MEAFKRIRPLGNRLLIETSEPVKKTPGGIILPDTAQEKPLRGKVLAIGPGRPQPPADKVYMIDVKAGDTVLFNKYAGCDYTHDDGKDYRFLAFEEVMAVVDPDTPEPAVPTHDLGGEAGTA